MTFEVRYTATAEEDLRRQFLWLRERSEQGANNWRLGIIKAVESLCQDADSNTLAPEGQRFGKAIHQVIYGKRSRGKYRILYIIENDEVLILTIRHGMREQLDEPDIESLIE